ncbi:MAG: energy transducer TonB [Bacteroidetes bacterium]|nr:energy transducer TonB [Bacteroidota bacterium]
MTRGKRTCKILKEIRQQIAEKNDIEYITSECTFQGECKGTCPKCEEEVRYLENELRKRQQLGKVVTIAGISLGVAGSFAACGTMQQGKRTSTEQELTEKTLPSQLPPIIDDSETVMLKGKIAFREMSPNYIHTNVDKMPSFPNGDTALNEFVRRNLVYPKKAINKGLEGTIIVRFVVNANGKVCTPQIIQSSNNVFDRQALLVIKKLPRFTPGEEYGRKVRVYYELPIEFKLPKEE